ncbi:MAG: hypothetical protein KatS3mg015_2337 [Fimbriimonadales bacterium]|nr:MAG: hypothetical protein KatS3mg015_2337 [Fimbriimonadales bacterium]
MPFSLRAWFALFLFILPLGSSAATYVVDPDPTTGAVTVRIQVSRPSTEFRMPAWAPGDYRIVNFGKYISHVRFQRDGSPVLGQKDTKDVNLWRIPDGADEVQYSIERVPPGLFSENLRVTRNEFFAQWPALLGWFEGAANEKHVLKVRRLTREDRVEVALERLPGEGEYFVFTAPDYDALLDAPLVMGPNLEVAEFVVYGKPHAIVGFGRNVPNLTGYVQICSRFIGAAARLFGELPYNRYLFLIDFNGPGGGLEHRDSSRLAIPSGIPPRAVASFLAHEYFHAFNVKRIRSKPLGPFNYTKPAVTGALWWLEGVTDYYAEVLLLRSGVIEPDEFLDQIGRAITRASRSRSVSLDESSRRVWEANNSSGYRVDYYTGGKAVGALLDLAIRRASEGKHSLDDVVLALYKETANGKPGFAEGRIRELCVQFGGEKVGEIYDECVMKAGPLPLNDVLPAVGLELRSGELVRAAAVGDREREILESWLAVDGK